MTAAVSAGLAIWVVLVAIVLLLATFRLLMTRGRYTVLHVRRSELSMIPEQVREDHRLTRIDFWGQLLTVIAVMLGLLLSGLYLYRLWTEAGGQVLN